jgi:hypothetical protein
MPAATPAEQKHPRARARPSPLHRIVSGDEVSDRLDIRLGSLGEAVRLGHARFFERVVRRCLKPAIAAGDEQVREGVPHGHLIAAPQERVRPGEYDQDLGPSIGRGIRVTRVI